MPSYAQFDVWQNTTGVTSPAPLQVVQTLMTSYWTASPGAVWTDIPTLTATIVPRFATSRVMIQIQLGGVSCNNSGLIRIMRNGNVLSRGLGDAVGSRTQAHFGTNPALAPSDTNHPMNASYMMFDLPGSTGAQIYSLQILTEASASNVVTINGNSGNADGAQAYNGRKSSTLTLWELPI